MMAVRYDRLAGMAALTIFLGVQSAAQARVDTPANPATIREAINMHATGSFDVKLTPQAATPGFEAAQLGRMTIDKQFHGDLEASSLGEMLSVRTDVQGSAGYVALERVTGTLHGRKGSFVFQHSGTMNRGAPTLVLTVVPDSGTGELSGLSGSMAIVIDHGKHSYTMDYQLP
jgi:hypothetical protein